MPLDIVRYVMGGYATSIPMNTLKGSTQPQHPTDLTDLRGSRLVTAQETQGGRRWAEAKIKQMSGGDPIKARFMRRNSSNSRSPELLTRRTFLSRIGPALSARAHAGNARDRT